MKSTNGRSAKRVPQRTCVSCRRVGEKRGLVRLVRSAAGSVDIDVTGKKAGRGAYLCRVRECWESGINGGRLERSLRVTLSLEDRDSLMRLGQDLTKESVGG